MDERVIVAKAPLRVSFIGGGSDYPAYFMRNQGAVLGCSIDKYVYVTLSNLSHFADENIRFTYRVTESVKEYEEIQHPVLRATLLDYFQKDNFRRFNVGTSSDLPGNSGLGSSSSFTVALIQSLNEIREMKDVTLNKVASEAVRIEREVLGEPGGWQDQYHAAFGGLRLYEFNKSGVTIGPVLLRREQLDELSKYFILVRTGLARMSSDLAGVISHKLTSKTEDEVVFDQVVKAREIANEMQGKSVSDIAKLLFSAVTHSTNWKLKISSEIYPKHIRSLGELGLSMGASCYKLLGAGGSGYILFGGEPAKLRALKHYFKNESLDFQFTSSGVQVIKF